MTSLKPRGAEQGPGSPNTKTSLASWWKQFKQKPHADLDPQADHETNGHSHGLHLPRPHLPHMSHSMNAINGANAHTDEPDAQAQNFPDSPIFGVALIESVKYAKASISLADPKTGDQFVYGYIPVVVAKCGVYLKKNAREVEGIFRLSGSARRIKELQTLFNTPPRFGKGLDWTGFNVHDAANVLRRYLNNLPEPIIPLQFYEQFRDPLREYPSIVEYLDAQSASTSATLSSGAAGLSPRIAVQSPSVSGIDRELKMDPPKADLSKESAKLNSKIANHDDTASPTVTVSDDGTAAENAATTSPITIQRQQAQKTSSSLSPVSPKVPAGPLFNDVNAAVERYQHLISVLPPLNRQLLMYILDLLSIFAARAAQNLMPAANLAAIFQPSILSHPSHDMSPEEYHLSRSAVEFLIQHSNKFLSHVESEAIRLHQEGKLDPMGSASSAPSETPSPYTANQSQAPQQSQGRRHSKSLSSVNSPAIGTSANPPSVHLNGQITSRVPVGQDYAALAVPRQRSESNGSLTNGSAGERTTRTLSNASDTGSGFLSSLKRTVSISRNPSQPRSVSVSSTSSNPGHPVIAPNWSPTQSMRSPDVPVSEGQHDMSPLASPMSEGLPSSESRRGLSALFSRRSKSPAKRELSPLRPPATRSESGSSGVVSPEYPTGLSPLVGGASLGATESSQSIDQAMTLLSSAEGPTGYNSLAQIVGRSASGSGIPGSTSANASRASDESEDDGEAQARADRNVSGGSDAAERAERSRRSVSKWRRSILLFNSSDSQDAISDEQVVLSPEALSPSDSNPGRSQSPSRWFHKMKPGSRDRSVGPDETS